MIVLGKKLINGRITREYADRIGFLTQELKLGKINPDLIGFSGGKTEFTTQSEAEEGEKYFKSLEKKLSLSVFETFCESQSKNTVENIRNILTHVYGYIDFPAKEISLELLSSDYHLDRLEIIDERMKTQSLLKPIREMVGELNLLRVPYPYTRNYDHIQTWCSKLYRIVDKLTVTRVNIEGVLDGHMEKILSQNLEDFGDNLYELSKNMQTSYSNDLERQKIQTEVNCALLWLIPYYFRLGSMCRYDKLSSQDKKLLSFDHKFLNQEIGRIVRIVDPDMPI